jgi:hypothetical protein
MINDETNRPFEESEPDIPPDIAYPEEAEAEYTPDDMVTVDADPVEMVASGGSDRTDDTASEDVQADIPDMPVVDNLDVEGALAAVASLSDILAEEEAAEQARLEQAEMQTRAAAERQARLEHPEMYFPMPAPIELHRGHVASVVPALLLILIGAWLTFIFTTAAPLDPTLIAGVVTGALAVTLLVRWLSSGRWARGTLFFSLVLLLTGLAVVYLIQPSAPGIVQGWPMLLIAVGGAFLLAGLMGHPVERRFLLPALAFAIAGFAGLAMTTNAIPGEIATTAASVGPIIAVIVVFVWLLPMVFRHQR